jgi:hypothetical protein
VKHQFYGLCVYCANLTMVTQAKISPLGLDCGRCNEGPRKRLHLSQAPPPRHPLVLDHKVACAACRDVYVTNTVIRVYDETNHTFEVPLCRIHLGAISKLGPVLTIGVRHAPMVYPLPLAETLEALAAYDVRTAWAAASKASRASRLALPPSAVEEEAPRTVVAEVLGIEELMARRALLPSDLARAIELIFFAHVVSGRTLTDADRDLVTRACAALAR